MGNAMDNKKELIYFPTWTAGRKGYTEKIQTVFQEKLIEKDLVYTTQRAAILDYFLRADKHLSQEELYVALKPRGIGKVTVFRTIKLLEECEIIDKVEDAKGGLRYEIKSERPHHDHLVCLSCTKIIELQWPELEKIQSKIMRKTNFTPYYHRHEVFGMCHECSSKG